MILRTERDFIRFFESIPDEDWTGPIILGKYLPPDSENFKNYEKLTSGHIFGWVGDTVKEKVISHMRHVLKNNGLKEEL